METNNKQDFIPKHGGYRKLISYQKAEIIYNGTVYFTGQQENPVFGKNRSKPNDET